MEVTRGRRSPDATANGSRERPDAPPRGTDSASSGGRLASRATEAASTHAPSASRPPPRPRAGSKALGRAGEADGTASPAHLLTIADLDVDTVAGLRATAARLDRDRSGATAGVDLSGRTVALPFDRPSTRTRLGFEAGAASLGGHAVALTGAEVQFGRGTETTADAARSVSTFVDGVVARVADHATLERFASAATVPVVNGLSDRAHPCEALADLQFLASRFETLDGLRVARVGDCTNVARSFASVCVLAGVDVRVACPADCRFDDESASDIRSLGPGSLRLLADPSRRSREPPSSPPIAG